MRLHRTLIVLSFSAALSTCTAAHDRSPGAKPLQEPLPADVTNPMASFARLVSGEWQTTLNDKTIGFSTWHWGPGEHSIRVADAVDVYYWHPGRKQVCTLSLSSYARGVGEGTLWFEGETAENVFDLYQTSGHRKLVMRWAFDGPDKYHEALFEPTDSGGLTPMSAWDHFRSKTLAAPRRSTAEEAPRPSERLTALESLVGHIWEARGEWVTGEAFHLQTVFEWVAGVDAIYARTVALRGNGAPIHLLDAYFYHHTGTDRLRCLALSNLGGVYEGDLTVLEGGALQLDLKGYEGDRVVPYVVRFDFEKDGSLHHRVWSLDGAERTLMLELHHTVSEMSKSLWLVFQDKTHDYWFGSDGQGLYRYDGKTITHFTTKDGLCSDSIRGIQQHKSGDILIATLEGIGKFDGKEFRTLIPAETTSPDDAWMLRPDDLWFAGAQDSGAVYRYDGQTLHRLRFPKTETGEEQITKYPRAQYPNMNFSPYDVYGIFRDSKGRMWFGTNIGVCCYDGDSFTWISEDELGFGETGNAFNVRSIIEDEEGKFWFTSTFHRWAVDRNDPSGPGINFRKEPGIGDPEDQDTDPCGYFMSSVKDSNGDLWMATYGAGVWRYDGESMTHYPVKDGARDVTLFSIYKDSGGDLWLGTHEAGAYKFNGKTFEKFRP